MNDVQKMNLKSLRFGCFETLSCWAWNGDEITESEESLSPKGCSNCDRAPFDTNARLESRSSLSVYTKSVSILPVKVCKSLMSVGNFPFIQNLGHLLFFVFLFIRLFMLESELLKPLVCSRCHTVDGFALPRPELCAGNKSCVGKFVKVFHILNIDFHLYLLLVADIFRKNDRVSSTLASFSLLHQPYTLSFRLFLQIKVNKDRS